MSYTTSGDNTIFTFDVENLFARVRNRTAMRTKMLRDGGTGKRTYDDLSLTDLEENNFNVLYPQAAAALFKIIQTLSVGIEDAFVWDANSITYTVCFPTYWDPNNTDVLNSEMMTYLEIWIVNEWFGMAGVPTIAKEFEFLLDSIRLKVKCSRISRTQRSARRYRGL